MVQLVNAAASMDGSNGQSVSQPPKQIVEVQVPANLIRTKNKLNGDGKWLYNNYPKFNPWGLKLVSFCYLSYGV